MKSFAHLMRWPLTLVAVTEGERDDVGDTAITTVETSVCGWWHPTTTTEDGDWQDRTLDLYLPPGTEATGEHRVSIPSGAYAGLWEMVGEPKVHITPTCDAPGIECRIRRVT